MSCRQFKKVVCGNTLPPPDDSDDDYEPPYANKTTLSYAGLEISDSDDEEKTSVSNEEEPEVTPEPVKVKKNNRKKRNKKAQRKISSEAQESVDEVARAVQEVNHILGSPEKAAATSSGDAVESTPGDSVMSIQSKHLNSAYEIKRKFGGDDDDENKKKSRHAASLLFKKAVIVPMDKYVDLFKRKGLSMSRLRCEDGLCFYVYDHSPDYQKRQRAYLNTHIRMFQRSSPASETIWFNYLSKAQANFHLEVLLECADSFFYIEEYTTARGLLEQTVAYLQYVAHPSFNVADPSTRLEYVYIENRPFHVAILKYLYLMTNTACHRTALELAKMLMNLDPTDPLAVIMIIDTLALRAREHEWLIQAIAKWTRERNAGYLYNIQYSNALAHFHVISKKKGDLTKATELLEEAIINFPKVVLEILTCASQKVVEDLQVHPLFETHHTPTSLNDICLLYAKFSWGKWREPDVIEWLKRTVVELTQKYDNTPELKVRMSLAEQKRYTLYCKAIPEEMKRHMSVIRPMAELLCEHTIIMPERYRSTDPDPPERTTNRFNYVCDPPEATTETRPFNVILDLLATLYLNFDPSTALNSDSSSDSDE